MVGDVVHVSLSASLGRTMMDEKFDSESGSFSHHSGTLCLHSSLEPHCHCSCLASISVCFLYIDIRSKTQRHRPVDETLQKVRWSGAISRVWQFLTARPAMQCLFCGRGRGTDPHLTHDSLTHG